jgi:hypothetical protein
VNAGFQFKRQLQLRDLEAAELQRFQIAHHQRTGEILTPDQARPLLARERALQQVRARDDMVRRLEHARRLVGTDNRPFVPEEGYPDE